MADRLAALEAESLGEVDLPDDAFVQQVHRLHFVFHAAALRADLHHPAVLACGGDHLLAFENVVACGLLDIDVLAGLAGPDGRERVPVIGDGHGDGLHRFIVEDLAHIGVALGCFAGELLDQRLAAFEGRLVNVAERDDVGVGKLRVDVHVILAASAEADDGDIDFVICVQREAFAGWRRRQRRWRRRKKCVWYVWAGIALTLLK